MKLEAGDCLFNPLLDLIRTTYLSALPAIDDDRI
jgi:hypothetical protein